LLARCTPGGGVPWLLPVRQRHWCLGDPGHGRCGLCQEPQRGCVRLHVLWRLCGYCVSGTGCIHPQWHLSSAGDDVSSLEPPLVIVAFCIPCDVRWRVVPRYRVVQTTGGGCNIGVRRHQRSRSFGYPSCTPPAPRVDGCLLGFGFGESRTRVDTRGNLVASPRCPYLEGVCMYNDTFLHPAPHPPTVSDACDRQIHCEVVVSVACG
jgi:hypothetical protein